MDEKTFDKTLASAIRRGDVSLALNDAIVDSLLEHPMGQVSDAAVERTKIKLRIRRQDAAIKRAKSMIADPQSQALGRFLEAVREKAGITKAQIAWRLKKDEEYVLRVERGDVNPTSFPAPNLADIMELFEIGLQSVSGMLVASIGISNTKHAYRVSARSHGGLPHDTRTEDVERALDAFARKMQKKPAITFGIPAEVDACLTRVRDELQKRGRKDLLV